MILHSDMDGNYRSSPLRMGQLPLNELEGGSPWLILTFLSAVNQLS